MDEISGTTWRATSVGGEEVADPYVPELTFDADGSAYGSTGVNRMRGHYEWQDGKLVLGRLATTMMAGPQPALDQEQRVLRLLEPPLEVTLDGDVLALTGPEGSVEWARAEPTTTL